jgi:hypothetical protein
MYVADGRIGFRHSRSKAIQAFEQLRDWPDSTIFKSDTEFHSHHGAPIVRPVAITSRKRLGQIFSDFFHWEDRCKVDKPNKRSAQAMLRLHCDGKTQRISKAITRWKKAKPKLDSDSLLWLAVRTNSATMSITQFPAHVAKSLADMGHCRKVLDFSGGWGDRLTGFLASQPVRDITIIEPRASACRQYHLQHKLSGEATKSLTVLLGPAQKRLDDVTPGTFDLILTSPPYLNLEIYDRGNPDQVHSFCENSADYLERFLYPCLEKCLAALSCSGLLALNIDNNTREGVVICQPVLEFMRSRASFVGTVGLLKQQGGNMTNGARQTTGLRAEPIYMWCRKEALAKWSAAFESLECNKNLKGNAEYQDDLSRFLAKAGLRAYTDGFNRLGIKSLAELRHKSREQRQNLLDELRVDESLRQPVLDLHTQGSAVNGL